MLAQAAPAPRKDPLVLDLDGDGIETLGQQAVTYFDHDGNGFAELTGWVRGDDGFLVFDRNGDGRINDGREMFGDQTVLASGAVAANGLQALSEWDLAANGGNADGMIDAGDAVWSSLRVWRDVDSDGFSDSGELFAAVKGAIMAFSRSLAQSLAPEVRVNCLCPGWIRTAWAEQASDYWQEKATRQALVGRWGTPEDVARAAAFLVSPAAAFITGQVIHVNGGFRYA